MFTKIPLCLAQNIPRLPPQTYSPANKNHKQALARVLWLSQVARISIYLPTTTDLRCKNSPLVLTRGKIMRIQSTRDPEGTLKSARELIIARRYHSWSFSPGFSVISFLVVKLIFSGFLWGFKFSCDLHLLFLNLPELMRRRKESYCSIPQALGFQHVAA